MAKLGRFAAVRVLSGALGLAWVVVVARWMPVSQFAAYSVLLAAVTVASLVGTLGVDRVLYRQLPEAHLARAHAYVMRLLGLALAARLVVGPPVALAVVYFTQPARSDVSLAAVLAYSGALAVSLVISDVIAITANALMRFELQARIASAVLIARLVAATLAHLAWGELTVQVALGIVLAGDLLQSATCFLLAVRPALREAAADSTPSCYVAPPLRVLARAAGTNYVSYLFGLPWQGSAATVLVGATAGTAEVALFALLQNLIERMRQYLPVQLLQNAFEPMLVRRYAATGDAASVAAHLELLRRANFCVLAGAAAVAWPCGSALIELATKGKYTGGGPLAALMLAALALRGVSAVLFIGANVVNEMGRLMRVYAVVTLLLLPLLVWCAWQFGAVGVVVVSVLPAWLLWAGLRAGRGHCAVGVWHVRQDIACGLAAGLAAGAAFLLGAMQDKVLGSVVTAAGVAALVYLAAVVVLKVFSADDLALMRANLRGDAA